MPSFIPVFAVLSTMAATVMGHGIVINASAGGVSAKGYNSEMQWTDPNAKTVGWVTPANNEWGFIDASGFQSNDIICHMGATPAQSSVTVAAGGTVVLEWNTWPESHKGPVMDYLASCNGPCSSVDKTSLSWAKIDERGLVDNSFTPGKWASDELIANGNKWTVTIPKSVKAGEYVLRHEIIGLHAAHDPSQGAQNYPQCINLKVTGDGTAVPSGKPATQFYTGSDPGIKLSIHEGLKSYVIPGPPVWDGASGSGSGSGATPTSTARASVTAPAATSSAPKSTSTSQVNKKPATSTSAAAPAATATPTDTPYKEDTTQSDSTNTDSSCTDLQGIDPAELKKMLDWWRNRRNSRMRRHVRDFDI